MTKRPYNISPESKKKQSQAMRKRWQDPEYIAKMKKRKTATWTPERRAAIGEQVRARLKDKPFTQEHKDKISIANACVPKSPEHRAAMRAAWGRPGTQISRNICKVNKSIVYWTEKLDRYKKDLIRPTGEPYKCRPRQIAVIENMLAEKRQRLENLKLEYFKEKGIAYDR